MGKTTAPGDGRIFSEPLFRVPTGNFRCGFECRFTVQDEPEIQGRGENDHRRVVFRRFLANSNSARFNGTAWMAVAVWNGANKERNGQKAAADWILLRF